MKIVVEIEVNEWLPGKELLALEKQVKEAIESVGKDSYGNFPNIVSRKVTLLP